MPTIFEVAEKAGVSITTVSRALNGHSDVSEKTRQRIMAAADALNYYPSATARSLRSRRTNTVVFAPEFRTEDEGQPFLKEFIGALALAAFQHDLSLLVTVAESPDESVDLYRELAGSRRADGIILTGILPEDSRIGLLQEIGVPFVAFGRTTDWQDAGYALADVDGAAGMRALVTHLHARGHRRIAYLSDFLTAACMLDRYTGYREALQALDLPFDERLVVPDLRRRGPTEAAVTRLFTLPPEIRPTALMCSSDWLALHVLASLQVRGQVVGSGAGQIAVTGFDDLPFSAYLHPALTTVRQPLDLACDTMLTLLSSLLHPTAPPPAPPTAPAVRIYNPRHLLITPDLIVRDSA